MPSKRRQELHSEERKEINRHLWHMHNRFVSVDSTLNRIVEHEGLHAKGNDQGYAGTPPHRHEPGTEERMGGVVLNEGEGM